MSRYDKYKGHTPPPWAVSDSCSDFFTVKTDEGEPWYIAKIHKNVGMNDKVESLANANLIADAPMLLARFEESERLLVLASLYMEGGNAESIQEQTFRDIKAFLLRGEASDE